MSTQGQKSEPPSLLAVANYPSNTGFAWDFIERVYSDVANRLYRDGVRTYVAYPALNEQPGTLAGSHAEPIELDVNLGRIDALWNTLCLIRESNVKVVYLSDRPASHPAYLLFRLAGVRWIAVHDHSSGARTQPLGLKRLVKFVSRRIPGVTADRVIGVSDYVARRLVEVGLVPRERVIRIWNAVEISEVNSGSKVILRERLNVHPARTVIACACRASPEKGVGHLMRAFDQLIDRLDDGVNEPLLIYVGSGPAFDRLETIRAGLSSREDILFTGYREDADEIVGAADVAVVPSVWEEAFGLAALEPMAGGVPVVASSVGGLPEVVEDGETGILVPPGDEEALAQALHRLLTYSDERERMGREGRARAQARFNWSDMIEQVTSVVKKGFDQ